MIYNTTSVKEVIAKIFRDFRPEQSNWIHDAYEWIGEALEYIGGGPNMIENHEFIKIDNFTGHLPVGIIKINQVMWAAEEEIDGEPTAEDYNKFKWSVGISDSSTHISAEKQLFNRHEYDNFIRLDGSYIKTTFESGWLLVSYVGIDLDEEGFPKIPDHPSVKEALSWYVLKQMTFGGYRHPTLEGETIMQMWTQKCTQARNQVKFPDVNEYQKFFESWVKLAPDFTKYEQLFMKDGVHFANRFDSQNYNNLQTQSGKVIYNPTSENE